MDSLCIKGNQWQEFHSETAFPHKNVKADLNHLGEKHTGDYPKTVGLNVFNM
jgi:hypothetical protein